jgi:hypothetical protein
MKKGKATTRKKYTLMGYYGIWDIQGWTVTYLI